MLLSLGLLSSGANQVLTLVLGESFGQDSKTALDSG